MIRQKKTAPETLASEEKATITTLSSECVSKNLSTT